MKGRFVRLRALAALGIALLLCACPAREAPIAAGGQAAGGQETPTEAKGLDPRAAFESSGLLGGLSANPESSVELIAAAGVPEAGVSLALGGALSTAAIARAVEGRGHELVLASGARASLPGPVLALTATGERIIVACANPLAAVEGSLLCYKAESEGERLVEAWKLGGAPVKRILAVPGGRVAAANEAGALFLVDATTGARVWERKLAVEASDLAYAPGLILAASASTLEAFDESTGASAWIAALTAASRSIGAGNGVALVLAESGSLSAFSLADGKGVGAAPGPFDSALKPIADGSRAIVALRGGGAAEIEVKSGQTLRSWSWEGTSSFLAADRDRIYAGVDGREGRGILLAPRAGEASRGFARLGAPPFDAPEAVTGARGGLLVLLMDGSLVLVGRERGPSAAESPLDAAIAPPAEAAAAIAAALGRFKPVDGLDARSYLRFDLFVQGMPVDTAVAFTAFRYDATASGKRAFAAAPPGGGAVIAIFDDAGRELAASIDELGSSSSASAFLEKGRTYWIATGWLFQAAPQRFRVYLK